MPININGGSYCDGGWWSQHLRKTETNERVEIIEFANLSAENIPDAFREMEALSVGTKCTNYFYQANINPRADEKLTPEQWSEAVDRLERNLGLTGQPRFVVEHEKEGRTHRHVVWSRIDTERMVAISDSLTAPIHERTSRELEIRFDLERGRSILVPDRDFDRPERGPKKRETFRAVETGIDAEAVKVYAQACKQRADNGQSFRAALEASGDYVLARGDRRDFVIIDRAGDDHSLARRLGMKAADMRRFMADLDPASLPSVAEAKAQQLARQRPAPAPEITPEPPLAEGRYDRLRADGREAQREQGDYRLLWEAARAAKEARQQDERARGVEQQGRAAEAVHGQPQAAKAADKPERPLNRVQGEIRMALNLTPSGPGFAAAVEDRGLMLCEVRAPEIERRNRHELAALLEAKANGVWMLAEGGASRLTPEQTESARESYAAWEEERREKGRKPFKFERYVSYVQDKQQERLAELQEAAASAPQREEAENPAPLLPTYAKAGDLVVIDGRGSIYGLNRRTTGKDRDELAHYLRPIDRAELMSVTNAQAVMREVKEERKTERAHARSKARINEPVGKIAGEIRTAWNLSRDPDPASDAERLNEALAARGMTVAQVSAAEAYASERTSAFAKELGNRAPVLTEGELVIVTGIGSVYRFNERTTGTMRPEIDARLAGIDRADLLNVTLAKAAMREASRAAWADAREQARPASWIEQRIAECADQAARAGAIIQQDAGGHTVTGAEALAERLRPEDERTHAAKTVHGADAFAAKLEEAGIALARVTEADLPQLDALRRADEIARMTADTNAEATKGNRFAELKAGELAAVTRSGDVYRINPDKLPGVEIPATLPGVIEARERFEIERADTTTQWDLKRAEVEAERQERAGDRQLGRVTATAEHAVHTAFETPAAAVGKTVRKTGKVARIAEKVFETAFGLLFGAFMAGPKDTKAQAEQKAKAATNEETLHAEAYAAATAERAARLDDLLNQIARNDDIARAERHHRTGGATSYDKPLERDDDYGRERER